MATPEDKVELTEEELAAQNAPAAPVLTPPVVEAPAPAAEAPVMHVSMDDLELYEEDVHVGSPSDWELISGPEDTIIATNRHTNAVYEGPMDGFNALLRG